MLAAVLELGYRVGAFIRVHTEAHRKGQMGTIQDGMFVLICLLLGFSLTLATARFAERRSLVVDKANAIGGVYP